MQIPQAELLSSFGPALYKRTGPVSYDVGTSGEERAGAAPLLFSSGWGKGVVPPAHPRFRRLYASLLG